MRKATGATILAAMFALLAAVPAQASTASEEGDFLRMLNQRRASKGKRALVVRSDLVTIARRHSARMADRGDIYHNPRLANEVRGEREVGENVGVGQDAESLDVAFWESSGHRANILWSGYNQVGIGVVRNEYEMYVTFVFVDRPASSPTQPAPDGDDEKKGTTSTTQRSPSSSTTQEPKAASTAQGGTKRDASRGASTPVREPERSVDLLVRTVALDAA